MPSSDTTIHVAIELEHLGVARRRVASWIRQVRMHRIPDGDTTVLLKVLGIRERGIVEMACCFEAGRDEF